MTWDFLDPLISPESNALSPCFIATLFNGFSLFIITLGIPQLLIYNYKIPTTGPLISRSYHQILKNCLVLLNIVLLVVAFIFPVTTNKNSFQFWSYCIYLLTNVTTVLPLHLIETSKSHIPSATLLLFWPIQFALTLIITIQQILADADEKVFPNVDNHLEVFSLLLLLVINGLIFVLEYVYYKPNNEIYNGNKNNDLFLNEPDIFSKLTFAWMNKLLKIADVNNGLEQEDLPPPPSKIFPTYTAPILEKHWAKELEKDSPSLLMALTKTFGLSLLGSLFFDLLESVVSFIQPQLLRKLIKFFGDVNSNPLLIKGLSIAFLMFLTNIITTVFYNQYVILTVEVALGCKAALMHMLYKKAMKLSSSEKTNRSTGDIINYISVDVIRIESLSSYVQTMFSAPTRLVLCLWSLYWLLGNATIMSIVTMTIMIPLNTILVKSLRSYHKQQMKLKDARTSFVTEILQNIKSIKLYAWETPMLDTLKHLRDDKELKNLNTIGILSAGINFAWTCVPFFVSCSTFAVFALISDIPLSPEIVFPALSLFDLLSDPILAIPSLITALIECSVSLNRIVSFLLADEIDESLVTRLPTNRTIGAKSVEISNATFLWAKPSEKKLKQYKDEEAEIEGTKMPALSNVNFVANKGELTCILGKVGSGKSTLLKCLLGELPAVSSDEQNPFKVEIAGSIAYCSQVPWIINASFKDNILFGHKFDAEFYHKTIEACQLLPDLEILPDGHETLVGEKGISLSGGQKARLSLARAIYTRSDVYLFDDILSAVDAHVGQKIIDNVLGKNGILKSKTKILATNSLKVLNQSTILYFLKDNTIFESGSKEDILNNQTSELFRLYQEFGRSNTDDEPTPESSLEPQKQISSLLSDENLIEGEFEGIGPLGVSLSENVGEELIRFDQKFIDEDAKDGSDDVSTLKSASIASLKLNFSSNINRKMDQTKETKEKGRVKLSTFIRYAKACSYSGIFLTLFLVVLTVGLSIGSNYWLMYWSENNTKAGSNQNIGKYVGIYALLGIGAGLFTLIRAICMWSLCSIRASRKLHYDMSKAVLASPLQFFETTPLGRIINRFSQDMSKVDSALPRTFAGMFSIFMKTFLTLIIISYNMPFFVVIIIILSFVYSYYQRFYVTTVRDLKRIVSITKSPIFALIQESLNGSETVRAYGQIERFSFLNSSNINNNQISAYCLKSSNRWLSTRLQFIGSFITLAVALMALSSLYSDHRLSAGLIGLIMSYAMRITAGLTAIVRRSVEIESDIICCERIFEYCNLPPEKDEESIKDKLIKPPKDWPANGQIEFNNYTTRYRENLDPVLKNVSFSIKSNEKIGIVGRTGAGKSSLVLSIFRIIEATEGNIEIDGIITENLKLQDLRKNLSIIPQDAQCIEGTVRYNLDPLNQFSDDQIWQALTMSRLNEHINSMAVDQNKVDDPLSCLVSESGNNLSVGQRQLICLARVLLKTKEGKSSKPSKILILDEATSSIDTETDNIIQQTIRKECANLTIITIAHRLNTILDSDKILVLERGEIAEFDSPENLLNNNESLFFKLCVDGGYVPSQ